MLDADNPYITSNTQGMEDKNVASLFCMDKKEWDIDVVKDMFNERNQECILNIPLNASSDEYVVF